MPAYHPSHRLGTVICTNEDPNVLEFSFVLEGGLNEVTVKRGEFVAVEAEFGTVVASVRDLVRTNRYFQHAEAVREYQSRGEPLRSIFPTDRWQYTLAHTRVVGFWINNRTVRPYTAVSPGAVVRRIEEDVLARFLRLDAEDGLNLGTIANHNVEFRASVDKLLSKHVAVLAMSGAGKSYFISVMLEELLKRSREQGRLSVVVIDVHGEYSYLQDLSAHDLGIPENSFEVEHIRGAHIQIPVSSLTAEALGSFASGMSEVQKRDLRMAISDIRKSLKKEYNLSDIIQKVKDDDTISKNTREALIGWLFNLESTGLFGKEAFPKLVEIIRPGKVTLIDLSDFISLKKKQIIVSHLVGELLNYRRQNRIPPFLLILEESHQFCPESRHELAIPKPRIETIAREGRKFYALLCLVTQRPVKLSTTVLSQCSNQVILRCTNPYDLDHIGRSSEGIDRSSLDAITTLEVGEALFVGETVSVPTFVKIRKRSFEPKDHTQNLSEALLKSEQKGHR